MYSMRICYYTVTIGLVCKTIYLYNFINLHAFKVGYLDKYTKRESRLNGKVDPTGK